MQMILERRMNLFLKRLSAMQGMVSNPAMRAARDGWFRQNRFGFVEFAGDQGAHQQAGFARRPAHPSVMAHAHEALRQHMGEPALEKVIHAQGDDMRAVGAALVAKQADVAGLVIT